MTGGTRTPKRLAEEGEADGLRPMNIDEYRALTRSIPCRFCDAAPGEPCVKPDLQRGQAECGEKFHPRGGYNYLRTCTVRGPHTVHAALPPHKAERVDYVHDDRSMDLHVMRDRVTHKELS